MKKVIKYIIAIITCISCNNPNYQKVKDTSSITYNEIEKASWLIGNWENNSIEGNATEIWKKKNDSTLFGLSFFIVNKDTVFSETISLEQNGVNLFYIPTVKEQNNEQPVKFALTYSTTYQLVFENPEHDYPQKIIYTQITKDSILAEISGMKKGKQAIQQFQMTRAK